MLDENQGKNLQNSIIHDIFNYNGEGIPLADFAA
jgi:hypothetical protein